jgi:hypothetical protein
MDSVWGIEVHLTLNMEPDYLICSRNTGEYQQGNWEIVCYKFVVQQRCANGKLKAESYSVNFTAIICF